MICRLDLPTREDLWSLRAWRRLGQAQAWLGHCPGPRTARRLAKATPLEDPTQALELAQAGQLVVVLGDWDGPSQEWIGTCLVESLPLSGLRVIATRAEEQAEDLVERLEDQGAQVQVVPTICFAAPDDPAPLGRALAELESFAWVIFTSPNGVRHFMAALRTSGGDARRLHRARLAAIGPSTAGALEEAGLRCDLVPPEYVAESLLDALRPHLQAGVRVLLPRAQEARAVLPEGLQQAGAQVTVVATYQTRCAPPPDRPLQADLVVFTSSSTARNFHRLSGGLDLPVAAIGPVTAATARELGYSRILTAAEYTLDGVVEALCRSQEWRAWVSKAQPHVRELS